MYVEGKLTAINLILKRDKVAGSTRLEQLMGAR